MRRYLSDLIPRLQRLDQELGDIAVLKSKHWIEITDDLSVLKRYIFKQNPNELWISVNGIAKKSSWDYLGNNMLGLEIDGTLYSFAHKFTDDKILVLKLDGTNELLLLLNESEYKKFLESGKEVEDHIEAIISSEKKLHKYTPDISARAVSIDEKFKEKNYPILTEELQRLKIKLSSYPRVNLGSIVVSYASNHSLSNELRLSNPTFCNDLVSGDINVRIIEKLYSVCGDNSSFRDDLSNYIITELSELT